VSARLSASVEATSIIRRAEACGDFAALLHKGDADRGALVIVVRSRGAFNACLERVLDLNGDYQWTASGPSDDEDGKVAQFLARKVEFDPDLWVIELDVAHPERFIAETTSKG
jgi:hypothetical protein